MAASLALRAQLIAALDRLPDPDAESTRLAVLSWARRRWWPSTLEPVVPPDGAAEADDPRLDALFGALDVPDHDVAGELLDVICERLGVGKVGKGAFHTPPALAATMALEGLARVLASRSGQSVDESRCRLRTGAPQARAALQGTRVLDPACGGGTLLVEARRWAPELHLTGLDTDATSLEVARHRLGTRAVSLHADDPLRAEGTVADYDLVLSNPPYVRHERLDAELKRELQERFGRMLGRGADLSAYFMLLALEQLRPAGVAVFLTASSWLDVRYGQRLRQVLGREGWPQLIAESATERVFSSAAVNAALTVFARGAPPEAATTELVYLDGPLAELDGSGRRRRVAVGELVGDDVAPRWGPRLRAPEVFDRLRLHPDMVPLEQLPGLTIGRGRRTGADRVFVLERERARALGLEERDLRPLARSPQRFVHVPPRTSAAPIEHLLLVVREASRLRDSASLSRHLDGANLCAGAGRPPWDLGDAPAATLLLPVAVHDRYFVVLNDAGWEAHQRFVTVGLADQGWREELAAVLSSFLVPLGMEVLGRRSLGEGALDVPPADWRLLPLVDPRSLSASARCELREAWDDLAREPPVRLPELHDRPARRRIDACLGESLGLSQAEVEGMRAAALGLLRARLAKAGK